MNTDREGIARILQNMVEEAEDGIGRVEIEVRRQGLTPGAGLADRRAQLFEAMALVEELSSPLVVAEPTTAELFAKVREALILLAPIHSVDASEALAALDQLATWLSFPAQAPEPGDELRTHLAIEAHYRQALDDIANLKSVIQDGRLRDFTLADAKAIAARASESTADAGELLSWVSLQIESLAACIETGIPENIVARLDEINTRIDARLARPEPSSGELVSVDIAHKALENMRARAEKAEGELRKLQTENPELRLRLYQAEGEAKALREAAIEARSLLGLFRADWGLSITNTLAMLEAALAQGEGDSHE
jgi:hypothetical protein